jgi:molybdenum cofactor biosynthesis enzyme MoaA
MPWKALFMDERDGTVSALPCCANWIADNYGHIDEQTTVDQVWNGRGAQRIRRLLVQGRESELCSTDCPWLNSGRFTESALRIVDGPPAFVENQRLNHQEIADRRLELESQPMLLRIIPTLRCNMHCRMCPQHHSSMFRPPALFCSESLALAPYLYDYQLHGGEVLVSPDFPAWAPPEVFDRNPQMRLSLVTNGTVIPPSTWECLRRVAINYITVSVNAATRPTYRHIAGADLFEEVVANTLSIRDLGRTHPRGNFRVFLSFVIMRSNYQEISGFVQMARRLELPIHLLLVVGEYGGESIYGDPALLARVADRLQAALTVAEGEAREEVAMALNAIERRTQEQK